MLVLTRRFSQHVKETDIMITTPTGDVITVSLRQIKGKQVRIGLDLPLTYVVDRAENYEEAKAQRALVDAINPIIRTHF